MNERLISPQRQTEAIGPGTPTDFQQLMAAIGSLMLRWGFLESDLDETILRLRTEIGEPDTSRPFGMFGDRLNEWRDLVGRRGDQGAAARLTEEIKQLRCVRNLVAHDLAGACAKPEDGEPHVWCMERKKGEANARRRIGLSQLIATIEAVDSCRLQLRSRR